MKLTRRGRIVFGTLAGILLALVLGMAGHADLEHARFTEYQLTHLGE